MGGAEGKLCASGSKATSLASEDDDLLRWEIKMTREKIVQLQETLYIQQCQRYESMGRKVPKRDSELTTPPLVDTAKMALPRLQELLDALEVQHAQLMAKEQEEFACVRRGSKLHRPTVDEVNFRSEQSDGGAGGGAGARSQPSRSVTSDLLLEDYTLLFGMEDEYGLQWDRRWAEQAAGPKDEQVRRRTRQGTCDKVVQELGLKHFGDDACKATGCPPQSNRTLLCLDQAHMQEPNALAGGKMLLGRYDAVCVRVCSDFDREWRFIKGPRNDFWVAHAAALNVGESTMATDFHDFCRPVNSSNLSGSLDEERYYKAMGKILANVVEASTAVEAQHLVFFPFGMGAFLRHLGQLDGNFADDEQLQRLRRRLAHSFVEVLGRSPQHLQIHLCLGFSAEEPQRNADAFLRALCQASSGLTSRLTIYPEGDSLQLAHELAAKSTNVVLVNGANRQLLGNHWFAGRAKMAIDENLHRRSWRLAAMSYLLNGFDGREPSGRSPEALQNRVQAMGGRVQKLPG